MKLSTKILRMMGGLALVGVSVTPALASSHREAPNTATDPQIDGTDTYAFVSPDDPDTVTVIGNYVPFQLPPGGPNFYPFSNDARYNLNIDTDGDAVPNLTYRFTFSGGFQDPTTFLYNTGPVGSLSDDTLNFKQNYTVEQLGPDGEVLSTVVDNGMVAPSHVGDASMPNYGALRQESLDSGVGADGTATFAGQADDPFFLDLRVFDLIYGGDLSEAGNPTLTGLNVNSIAVQLPKSVLADNGLDDSGVIGVWSTSERQAMLAINTDGSREASGDWVQTSRLGNPLVNEVVSSIELKDAFNALKPEDDASVAGLVDRVNDPELPKLIEAIYGIPAPETPRDDLFAVFLTGIEGLNQPTDPTPSEVLRLNINTEVTEEPNRLGVLAGDAGGFPNGRRLADDVVDIEIQVLEGALEPDDFQPAALSSDAGPQLRSVEIVDALAAGDAVDTNDVPFETAFPYVALPHAGSTPGNGGLGGATTSAPPTTAAATTTTAADTTTTAAGAGPTSAAAGPTSVAGPASPADPPSAAGPESAAGPPSVAGTPSTVAASPATVAGTRAAPAKSATPAAQPQTAAAAAAPASTGGLALTGLPVLPLLILAAGLCVTGLGIARSKRAND